MSFDSIDRKKLILNNKYLICISFLFLYIVFVNYGWAQQVNDDFKSLKLSSVFRDGTIASNYLEESFHSGNVGIEYFFDKNQSVYIDIFLGRVNENKIPCSYFEKGLTSFKFSYYISSLIFRSLDQTINFALAFGGEYASFKSAKGYHLKGHSILVRPTIFIDSNQLIPFLNYNFSIANSLSIGIFKGELKPINNENTYNCSFYRLSIESGFHFPIFKKISVLVLYQSDLFGEEISYHGFSLGILCFF